ncbi:MAG: hemin uptake protein HemP [Reyranellales bacterium]
MEAIPRNLAFAASGQAGEVIVPARSRPVSAPRVTTDQLMRGRREIILQHGVEEYRLRITAAGKLILTK